MRKVLLEGSASLAILATVDTIELFMRWPPKGLRKLLEAALGRRVDKMEECHDRTGRWLGLRVGINRPNRAVIQVMTRLVCERRLRCCVSRVDVAIDFSAGDENQARALAEWLSVHTILKWRPRRGKKQHYTNGGAFWVLWTGGHSARDLCVYIKPKGIVRLELRFQKPAAVRRAGLDKLESLDRLNVKRLIYRNIKAERFSDRYATHIVRTAVKDDVMRQRRSTSRNRSHPVLEGYRARIAARVRRILSTYDMQSAKRGRGTEVVSLGWLRIPDTATIPSQIPDRK